MAKQQVSPFGLLGREKRKEAAVAGTTALNQENYATVPAIAQVSEAAPEASPVVTDKNEKTQAVMASPEANPDTPIRHESDSTESVKSDEPEMVPAQAAKSDAEKLSTKGKRKPKGEQGRGEVEKKTGIMMIRVTHETHKLVNMLGAIEGKTHNDLLFDLL